MSSRSRASISASRILLGNQYAHIEQIEDPLAEASPHDPHPRRPSVSATASHRTTWSYEDIEQQAISIQRKLWAARRTQCPNHSDLSPIAVLDPAKAAETYGFEFEVVDSLGVYTDRRETIAVAGQIDRKSKRIRISREFDPERQLFTAAHEIGHLILHPHVNHLHRDRSINGIEPRRARIEIEADKFAAYFLMPRRVVLEQFRLRFITLQFELNQDTIFALGSTARTRRIKNRRELARALASANCYNGKHFHSLANHFGVTTETMAIRLEELETVSLPVEHRFQK